MTTKEQIIKNIKGWTAFTKEVASEARREKRELANEYPMFRTDFYGYLICYPNEGGRWGSEGAYFTKEPLTKKDFVELIDVMIKCEPEMLNESLEIWASFAVNAFDSVRDKIEGNYIRLETDFEVKVTSWTVSK